MRTLQQLLEDSAHSFPGRLAAEDPARGKSITYRALNDLSDGVRDDLLRHGVQAADRVGICARKSIAGLASIFGILKAGAAYVPVAHDAKGRRKASIFSDCRVKVLLADKHTLNQLRESPLGEKLRMVGECAVLSPYGDELALVGVEDIHEPAAGRPCVPDNLAYVLYTSGSTGQPKGVMHSHGTALSFVDWCSETFEPTPADRFSSHAPFHFDLSIFDVYVAVKHGANLVLVGEEVGKQAAHLAALIAERRVSIWYSTPSVLRLLVEYGRLERHDYPDLRLVLFAGEVFPPRYLRALIDHWPDRRYFNLYGPTETNVCTFKELGPGSSGDPTDSASIGRPCSGTLTRVVNENGRRVRPGEEGELQVSGGTVMLGYWNRPDLDAETFVEDSDGRRWYRTGDLVNEAEGGDYLFLGRRDRMVKRRGFRIELGEIESLLYRHPLVTEVAVVAFVDREDDVRIRAYLCWSGETPPSLVTLKRYCAETMPSNLIPDQFTVLEAMPTTSTNKVDYRSLVPAR